MKKNLEIEVPKGAHTEIKREHKLKKNLFTRTRIVCLCLILVASLSITGTLAYLSYTSNQTPNRAEVGQADVRIGERVSIEATAVTYDTDGTYDAGLNSKVVAVYAGESDVQVEENVTVSLVPQVESKSYVDTSGNVLSGGYENFDQNWSGVQTDASTGRSYIETSIVRVWLAEDWSDNWTFNGDGTFTYKTTIKKDEKTTDLMTGVTLQSGVNADDYQSVKVVVIAQGVSK